MIEAFLIYLLLKENLNHETQSHVPRQIQAPLFLDGIPHPQEKRHGCEHCHARRHPPVNDALLSAAKRLQGPITDEERKAQDRLFDICGVP